VGKTYRPYDPRQSFLLPPSPLEWLPDEHLAYFVLDVVEELKLSAITSKYEAETRGQPPHDPRMMVALLVYGYCVGERSSRRIEKKTVEDVAFRVLAGGNHPDHSRISEFRRIHLEALSDLFFQVLMLCRKAKLVKLGHVALDGTKMKANASKHKAMSYQRMKEDEARLKAEIATMFQEAESIDAAEDARHGKDQRGDELPDELRRRETRLVRIRQLRAELAEYFAGRRRVFEVPLHVKGSPFQERVWQELVGIPYGETRSYEEIARRVGSPGAVRAVGQANGMNRIAIVLPCHRVVNKSGKLGGYGGGLWRKERLLALERGQPIEGLLVP